MSARTKKITIHSCDEDGNAIPDQTRTIELLQSDTDLRLVFKPRNEGDFEPDLWVAVDGDKIRMAFHQDDGWDAALYLEYDRGTLRVFTDFDKLDLTIDEEGVLTQTQPVQLQARMTMKATE